MARLGHQQKDAVRILDRRRHQLRRLVAGVAEHDALVAGALVLVVAGIDALGDVGRLLVHIAVDLGGLEVEAPLHVADLADGFAGGLAHLLGAGRVLFRHLDLAQQHHPVGGGGGLDGNPALRLAADDQVDDGVRDLVAQLVGMAFRDRLGSEEVVLMRHWSPLLATG
jgi:hypothetical protein